MTKEEAIAKVNLEWARAAGMVKLVCGVGNNTAWAVTLSAFDEIRQHPCYGLAAKRAFKAAIETYHSYERRLIYASQYRMFHLADLAPSIRKRYGDITDRQYYEFWTGCGSDAYAKTQPLITSLANKYRLIMVNHNIKQPETIAWAMTAQAALDLAVTLYESVTRQICQDTGYKPQAVDRVFRQFCFTPIAESWRKAIGTICPKCVKIEPSELESKNLDLGITQLAEAWTNIATMFNSVKQAAEDYDEVFRTKGEQKKTLRELSEIANEGEKEFFK